MEVGIPESELFIVSPLVEHQYKGVDLDDVEDAAGLQEMSDDPGPSLDIWKPAQHAV